MNIQIVIHGGPSGGKRVSWDNNVIVETVYTDGFKYRLSADKKYLIFCGK